MKNILLPFYLKLASILIIIISIGYIAVLGKEVLSPLLFSFLFALLLLPLASFLEKKAKFSRSVASFVSVLILLASVSFASYILETQIVMLAQEWPLLKEQVAKSYGAIQVWLSDKFQIDTDKLGGYIDNTTNKVVKESSFYFEKTLLSLSSIFLFLVFTFIFTLFLLLYRKLLMRFIVAAFKEKNSKLIYDISENIKQIIKKYIFGLFLEMVVVTVLGCSIFFVLGIKYVFLLGMLVGVLNLLPYVGIFTALVISTCITLATSDLRHAVYVAVVVIIIHLLDSNFLMPKIVGSQVRINPFIVVLGVVVGEMLWGISGMFLSIPYLAIAKIIFDRVDGLQPWGILLGDEGYPPKKVKSLMQLLKRSEKKAQVN